MPARRRALLIIDVQPDFMPGGALACHEGDAIVPGVDALLRQRAFDITVATQDWHPRDHVSFASQHPGHAPFDTIDLYQQPQTLWPDHCVQGSAGAQLHPAIDWNALDLIVRKGSDRAVDSYSAFRENHSPDGQRPPTGLAGWLRELGASELYLCGLARDVCVLWSAQDAVQAGFRVNVLWPLTRPVTPASDDATRAALASAGVTVLESLDALSPQAAQRAR